MTAEVDVTTDPSTEPTEDVAPRRFGLVAVLIPWVLAVAFAAVAAVALVQWQGMRNTESARDQARTAAIEVVRLLTEWDASDGLDDTREDLKAVATGDFSDQIDDIFGADEVSQLVDANVRSEGEIGDVFVQSLEGDTAEVFAVVTQTTTTETVEVPLTVVQRAAILLERQGDRWLVASVELTSDETLAPPS